MIGRLPKDQAGGWQLISVDINRQCSSAISLIVEKLLTPVCAHAHLPVIFSVQETRSWNVPELKLPGHLCYGGKMVLATLVVSDQFFKMKRSWRFEERCTAVLFGAVFVMTVRAPDCKKDLDVHETFIKTVTKISWEGRRGEANDFYNTGDFNVEREVLSTIWE